MKAYVRVIRHFFKTTTLHGFKYLFSKYYCDRFGWMMCCCASACCAAVLCTVVWERFMQVPALLTLKELYENPNEVEMPLVAICPPANTVADMFVKRFPVNESTAMVLPSIIGGLLRRKYLPEHWLTIMAEVLDRYGLTLTQALIEIMPACEKIVINCQWQGRKTPCTHLFAKLLTQWGVCCVAKPNNFKTTISSLSRRLSLGVQCYDELMSPNCNFFTKYDVEEWIEPIPLAPGHFYKAHITFASVQDSNPEKLFDKTCASHQFYCRSRCLLKCMERRCGCLDVIRLTDHSSETQTLEACPLPKLNCLRAYKRDNNTCNCLPTCRKVSTSLIFQSSPINAFSDTLDSLYPGLNVTLGSILNINLSISGSRMFMVRSTETWITMLSSLGGVFNMFLGVGFFTALELLFLIIIKLPIAVKRSTVM